MGLGSLGRVLTAGVGAAVKGEVKGNEYDLERTKELLAQRAAKRKLELDEREIGVRESDLKDRASSREEDRRIREEENKRRDLDRDAQRGLNASTVEVNRANAASLNEQRRDLSEGRQQRRRIQSAGEADTFADRYVASVAARYPNLPADRIGALASDLAGQREQGEAGRLGMKATHYQSAARRAAIAAQKKASSSDPDEYSTTATPAAENISPTRGDSTASVKTTITKAEADSLRARGVSEKEIRARSIIKG